MGARQDRALDLLRRAGFGRIVLVLADIACVRDSQKQRQEKPDISLVDQHRFKSRSRQAHMASI